MPNDPFSNITHIVYDLDGLLIDSEPLWKIAEKAVLHQLGKNWDAETAKQHIGLRIDEVSATMIHLYDLSIDSQTLSDMLYAEMRRLIRETLVPMPGADEAVRTLHQAGFAQAIASSSTQNYIQSVVDKFNWQPYISVIASADNVPNGKPAPDVYLAAAAQLGASPQHCLALEDSLNGAKAARAAGMQVISVPGHDFSSHDFEGIAHFIYPSLPDVLRDLPH